MERKLLLALIAFLLAAVTGCYGGSKVVIPEPRKSVDDEEETVASAQAAKLAATKTAIKGPAAAKQPVKPKSPPRNRGDATTAAAQEAMTGGPNDEINRRPRSEPRKAEEEPVSPRPADLSAWTPDDFRSALADRDILLLQAVPLLGRSGGDADANAKLLLELLEMPAEGSARRDMAQPIRGLPQAVVTALAANPSEVARNALKEILLGTRRTNLDDRMFTTAALAGIVQRGNAEADALLFTILTMPNAIRPPGRSTFNGPALQKECATLVRDSASPRLRVQLAQYVAEPTTSAADRKLLVPLIMEPRVENLRAQIELALADGFDTTQRTAVRGQLLAQARRASDAMMGMPDTTQLSESDDGAVSSVLAAVKGKALDESGRIAEQLWTPAVVDRLAEQLTASNSINEEPDLFALATSLPCQNLRAVVRKQMSQHWSEGDQLARSQSFAPASMRDPGMLLVLKSLPRVEAQSRVPSNGRGANNPQQQRLAQERKAKSAWDSAVQTMTTTLMRRCEIAGKVALIADQRASSNQAARPIESVEDLNRLLAERQKTPKPADEEISTNRPSERGYELPLELPKNAELNTVFQIQWPEQLEGRVTTAVSPLSIYYAQIQLEEQGQKVMKHFERQLKGAQARRLENGAWLDSATRPTVGKLRSVDVMITRSRPRAGVVPAVSRNSAEELTVEILWIEINDFMSDNSI